MIIGAHESAAGGVHNAVRRGELDECEAIQVFVRPNRRWTASPLTDTEVMAFRRAIHTSPIHAVVAHDIYLVNLASSDPEIQAKSKAVILDEASRCSRLGIPYLIFHAGSARGAGEERGMDILASSLDDLIPEIQPQNVTICLENSAGQGTSLCHSLRSIRDLLDRMRHPDGLGVCIDTCHAFAAGYHIDTAPGWNSFMDEVETLLSIERIKAFHLNDSKSPAGSRVDRHAAIGEGHIGSAAFARIVTDDRLSDKPGIVEYPDSPKSQTPYLNEIRLLKELRDQ